MREPVGFDKRVMVAYVEADLSSNAGLYQGEQ